MTPLVLVHGFLGGSAQWTGFKTALKDLDMIAVDLPGFGEAAHEAPCASIGGYAEWVITALQKQSVKRYHLLGHSMGGMIAQEIARRDASRVDNLILYGTGPTGVLPGRFEPISESKRRAQADGAHQTARRIAATWLLEQEASVAFPKVAEIAQKADLPAMLAGLDAMESWSGVDGMDQIASDTLIIWGDRDRTYPWSQTEALWRGIRHTGLCVVPNCAHLVHLEEPDIFARVVRQFLRTSFDRPPT